MQKHRIIVLKQNFKVQAIKHHDKSIFKDVKSMRGYVESLGISVTIENNTIDGTNLPKSHIECTTTKDIEVVWKTYLAAICINLGYDLSLVQDYLDQSPRNIVTDDKLIKLNETIDNINHMR